MTELPANLSGWLLLASLPLLLAACTSFTKISLVLAALRVGMGAERLLPLGSMFALALLLTAMVMMPVAESIAVLVEEAGGPDAIYADPWARAPALLEPLWEFLHAHAQPRELERFSALSHQAEDQALVLIPAFLVSELGRGLSLAVAVLLPFVAVDLICAQVLALLGLGQTPSSVVALPAKLLLFLAADGWGTVIVGLVEAYQ